MYCVIQDENGKAKELIPNVLEKDCPGILLKSTKIDLGDLVQKGVLELVDGKYIIKEEL